MINWTSTYRVAASAEQAFDVIGTHVRENHPKWEKEVVEIRPVTPGPVRLGTRAVMVRKEMGRVSEAEYEVTAFEPDRKIAFRHPDSKLDFMLSFDLAPVDATSCDLTVVVAAQPKGAARAVEPLMRLAFPKRSNRISTSMVRVIEAAN